MRMGYSARKLGSKNVISQLTNEFNPRVAYARAQLMEGINTMLCTKSWQLNVFVDVNHAIVQNSAPTHEES